MTRLPPPAERLPDDRFHRLRAISHSLAFAGTPREIADTAVRHAATTLAADRVLLLLMDAQGALRVGGAHGMRPPLTARLRDSLEAGLVRELGRLLSDRRRDRFLAVPLVAGGRVTGVLAVVRAGRASTREEDDEILLEVLAAQAALALDNVRLEQRREVVESRGRVRREAERVKRDALETIGHDLRSPLQTIRTCAALLRTEVVGALNDRQKSVIGRIELSGRHILALVEKTLELAGLNAGAVPLKCRAISPGRIVHEAASIVQADAGARKHTLDVDIAAELTARADPDRLRQALVNLLTNAIKYSPSGGRIRIACGPYTGGEPGAVAITVADDGPGIPPDQREAIFEPYHRVGGGRASGTGLGLSIARAAVRQMGGDLTLDSTARTGAVFVIRLPQPTADASGA